MLFLLRRGILSPPQLSLWLVEPNEDLDFRRPLAVLGDGDINENLVKVMQASATFVHPGADADGVSMHPSVAASAAGSERRFRPERPSRPPASAAPPPPPPLPPSSLAEEAENDEPAAFRKGR